MKENEKKPEQICDIRVYEGLPLSMRMLQGWFNDQHECFELFLEVLTDEEKTELFNDNNHLAIVQAKYKELYEKFRKTADNVGGPHKRSKQLRYGDFNYWTKCIFNEIAKTGGLEALLGQLGTVEAAHDKFRPWFKVKQTPRSLNAADAARILACYFHLQPEERPLLARGALRGAAILLVDKELQSQNIEDIEKKYKDEEKLRRLEELAAAYINEHEELKQGGKWRMQEGESWFCEVVHKKWYPER